MISDIYTVQTMKYSVKDVFCKFEEQVESFLHI